jgi:RNA polymerase sigma-70 factor (ECF subfamily)
LGLEEPADEWHAPHAAQSNDRVHEGLELRQLLARAIAKLSPEDRMVIVLLYFEDRPVSEAAELLGWSRVSVKVRSYRARRKLERIVRKLGGAE